MHHNQLYYPQGRDVEDGGGTLRAELLDDQPLRTGLGHIAVNNWRPHGTFAVTE